MSYSADTFVADEQPTTAKWNKLWSNDASFNDGTGIADDALLARHFATGAVDAPARSQVVKSGSIAAATLGTTGNKAVTGVGFTPKIIFFNMKIPSYSTTSALFANGMMTTADQYYTAGAAGASFRRIGSSSKCLGWINVGSGAADMEAGYVSMDSDGFTINVSTATTSAFDWSWVAMA